MEVELTILAQDVINKNYLCYHNCPITLALKRAGFPNLRDAGTYIVRVEEGDNIMETATKVFLYTRYHPIKEYIHRAYELKGEKKFDEIKDFTYTITLPDEEIN